MPRVQNVGPKPFLKPPGLRLKNVSGSALHRNSPRALMIPQQCNGKYTRSLMSWLPIASDFPTDFGEALESANEIDYLEKLSFLAQHRLGYLETLQLDRALSRLALKAGSGFVAVRLAVLPSSTVDHLLPAI